MAVMSDTGCTLRYSAVESLRIIFAVVCIRVELAAFSCISRQLCSCGATSSFTPASCCTTALRSAEPSLQTYNQRHMVRSRSSGGDRENLRTSLFSLAKWAQEAVRAARCTMRRNQMRPFHPYTVSMLSDSYRRTKTHLL